MTPSMCHAILSPIYKDKGSKDDQSMYRPISVTTIPYRILAKCIAQKLSLAVPTLVGDPQVGHCPGRTYDENVRLVRQTIHDINKNRPGEGGIMLCLDNAKAFDRLQHAFMIDVLRAFNPEAARRCAALKLTCPPLSLRPKLVCPGQKKCPRNLFSSRTRRRRSGRYPQEPHRAVDGG